MKRACSFNTNTDEYFICETRISLMTSLNSVYAIYAPREKDERFYQKYKERGLGDFEATYASMIERMDHSPGDILAN